MKIWIWFAFFNLGFLFYISPLPVQGGQGDKVALPSITFGWMGDKNEFQAGDIAIIKIKFLENSLGDKNSVFSRDLLNFTLSVNGKKGNNSYVSGVIQYLDKDPMSWNISFTTIRAGRFTLVITDDHFGIMDPSLHFTVTAGHIYPPACIIYWMDFINEFVAGSKVHLFLLLKDAFGNSISSRNNEPNGSYFKVFSSYENGSIADQPDISHSGWNELGFFGLEFIPRTSGSLLLHVYGNNQSLSGIPLTFIVKPGSIDIRNTLGKWKYKTNAFQVFSRLEMFIYQRDQFENLVPGFYPFDACVTERTSSLSIPVADLLFEEVAGGIQLLSFIVSIPGQFRLIIFDAKLNESIWNLTYDFSVFIGYCHHSNSFANGSGLMSSIAGRTSSFRVYLQDLYHNPSPVEIGRLRVDILSENRTLNSVPIIIPLQNHEDNNDAWMSNETAKFIHGLPSNIITNLSLQASQFNVTYTPQKCGDYKIWIFCGNIPINDGNPYVMKVSPGLVDTSLSSVAQFQPNVKTHIKNEVLVRLVDSYRNPISSEQTKLRLLLLTENNSSFMRWEFHDNRDGSYTGYYMAKDLGAYNMCILFDNRHLSPCPFEVHAYEREYFSEANNDSIFVWEDESLAFDVLSNDYVVVRNSTTIEFSIPIHGSLVQYGQLFRYTPYQGFFGEDFFSYTFCDINKNIATAMVFIFVLCKPPQFISLPEKLHVIEDIISPQFGGFPGFEMIYSDDKQNISLAIRAKSGNVFFSPIQMQIHQKQGNFFSVSRGDVARKELVISGYVEPINSALKYLQYLGNENFYGNDIITLNAMNDNGVQEARVPAFVAPINDIPSINAPKFIILESKEASNGHHLFEKQRDVFELVIVDSDIFNFSGNKSLFIVMISMEVNEGTLSTTLPVNLISSSELKIQGSNQWQPLQTFVTISNHFVLKGKGLRFRGTISDCNSAIQQLHYQDRGNDAVLTLKVNDLGNYGCYPDCSEMTSMPLCNEVIVSLIKRPVHRLEFLVLRYIIILEIIMMLLLGAMLLFFICKCLNALHRDRRDSFNVTPFSTGENLNRYNRNGKVLQKI
ncbi:protein GAMETE EXPRESSED 2-like isoform X2 [Zingiber officinale]|uniref:protein GAMETE EXPRESSED 2-like isoform X2 n=1 Tax=Zingiber officinale TaxID=94328 RepID=UPI001C4BD7DC|nr:protein GAMETE EXPRESSED 2-like isoform X2 [Zingiber officinale]